MDFHDPDVCLGPEAVSRSASLSVSQSVSQSISQPASQRQSISQPVSQSVGRPASRPDKDHFRSGRGIAVVGGRRQSQRRTLSSILTRILPHCADENDNCLGLVRSYFGVATTTRSHLPPRDSTITAYACGVLFGFWGNYSDTGR